MAAAPRAVLYSLIASAKRHGLDPFVYLRDVLARISDHPSNKLHELLPDQWKLARSAAAAEEPRRPRKADPQVESIDRGHAAPDHAPSSSHRRLPSKPPLERADRLSKSDRSDALHRHSALAPRPAALPTCLLPCVRRAHT